jgi:hypothetical protein
MRSNGPTDRTGSSSHPILSVQEGFVSWLNSYQRIWFGAALAVTVCWFPINSHTRNILIAPDHPEGEEGGLGCVGGVAHNGVHPQASVSAVFRWDPRILSLQLKEFLLVFTQSSADFIVRVFLSRMRRKLKHPTT